MTLAIDHLFFGKVLRDINLQVAPGEMLALVGNNGAGKSTLLKLINGELAMDKGVIRFNGQSMSEWKLEQRAQVLATLPQSSHLNFAFSVAEVVALGRYPHSTGSRRDQEIIASAMHFTDVFRLRDTLFTQLSGGEKQRVQLARVLAQIWQSNQGAPLEQRLLLLDEPVNGLDLHHQQQLFTQLQQLAADGLSIIFIVHDLNLAARYGDKVAILSRGAVGAYGTPTQVLTDELIRRYFGLEVQVDSHPVHPVPHIIPL